MNNRKEQFRLNKTLTDGYIDVVCYDCSGDHHNVDYVATERFEFTVEEDSAAARIHSGGNFAVQGDVIANRYSSLSASGNINIIADTLRKSCGEHRHSTEGTAPLTRGASPMVRMSVFVGTIFILTMPDRYLKRCQVNSITGV